MARKDIESFCVKWVEKIADQRTGDLYRDLFKRMSNNEFNKWMDDLETGKTKLQVFAPNGSSPLSTTKNFKLAKELGHNFFQRVTFGQDGDRPEYTPAIKFPIFKLSLRRPVQLLSKKISVTKDTHSRDMWTGQVTGNSLSAKVSFPELQLLSGMGMDKTMVELMKIKGGDRGSEVAMNTSIARYGDVSQERIEPFETGVESTRTLSTLLKAVHLNNNL